MTTSLADNIRQLREIFGLSQAELARRVGFPAPQSVSDIERGQREVKAWELAELAEVFHTPTDVLLGIEEPAAVHVFWRRGSVGASPEQEKKLLKRARRFAQLEEWCDVPTGEPLEQVEFDVAEDGYEKARWIAQRIGRSLELGSRPASSLYDVLEERFRVKIFHEPLGESESAACARGEFGSAVLMNSLEAPWRRNYNLAHEVFHLVTWEAMSGMWPTDEQGMDEEEWARVESYANAFASQLLLPADEVSSQYEARFDEDAETPDYVDLIEMAREFAVSTSALLWRLVYVGKLEKKTAESILQDPKFREKDRQTMASHWDEPDNRLPDRYRRLAHLAYEKGMISVSKLAEYLECSLSDLSDVLEGEEDVSAAGAGA